MELALSEMEALFEGDRDRVLRTASCTACAVGSSQNFAIEAF